MKDYTVVSCQRWGKSKGQIDEDGYFMHSITLEGYTNEPIDFKSKELPKVADILHGEIVKYTSKAGNQRLRFETAEIKKKDNLTQDRIMCQFALRLAVENCDYEDEEKLVDTAEYFIKCIDKLMERL